MGPSSSILSTLTGILQGFRLEGVPAQQADPGHKLKPLSRSSFQELLLTVGISFLPEDLPVSAMRENADQGLGCVADHVLDGNRKASHTLSPLCTFRTSLGCKSTFLFERHTLASSNSAGHTVVELRASVICKASQSRCDTYGSNSDNPMQVF